MTKLRGFLLDFCDFSFFFIARVNPKRFLNNFIKFHAVKLIFPRNVLYSWKDLSGGSIEKPIINRLIRNFFLCRKISAMHRCIFNVKLSAPSLPHTQRRNFHAMDILVGKKRRKSKKLGMSNNTTGTGKRKV